MTDARSLTATLVTKNLPCESKNENLNSPPITPELMMQLASPDCQVRSLKIFIPYYAKQSSFPSIKDLDALMHSLQKNTSVKELDLGGITNVCEFAELENQNRFYLMIANMLLKNRHIEVLKLSGNQFTKEGVQHLTKALSKRSLKQMHLEFCHFPKLAMVDQIVSTLMQHSELELIDLDCSLNLNKVRKKPLALFGCYKKFSHKIYLEEKIVKFFEQMKKEEKLIFQKTKPMESKREDKIKKQIAFIPNLNRINKQMKEEKNVKGLVR